MTISENYSRCAWPATNTLSGIERKAHFLENLQRELPLANERREQKRARYIADIRAHRAAGKPPATFRDTHPTAHLDDPDTTLMYCLFASERSPAEHAHEIGVPPAALMLYQYFFDCKRHDERIEHLASILPATERANAFAIDWLRAIGPGIDLTTLPSRFVHALLTDPEIDLSGMIAVAGLRVALDEIIAMHVRTFAGDQPSREAWKKVQRAMLAYSDAVSGSGDSADAAKPSELDLLVTRIVENAASDCAESDVIGDEIVADIAEAFALKQGPVESYTASELALGAELEALRSTDDKASYAALAKSVEGQAYYAKREIYWQDRIIIRSQVRHQMALIFIRLTQTISASQSAAYVSDI